MLNEAKYFQWRNYSVPVHDPVVGTDEERKKVLTAALDRQIKPVNCVLIISGMYVNHSDWIQVEIDIVKKYEKPIVGLKPRGSQVTPKLVQDAAKEMVGWSTDSIVSAIRKWSL